MQKAFFLLMLIVSSLYANPEWTDSIEEAMIRAQKENKQIMVMLSKDACDACWYMENIVFDDDKVKTLLYTKFIPVYLDVHQDKIPVNFKYVGTPTFYFLDAKGKKLGFRISGVKNIKDFTKIMNKVLNQGP